MHSTARPGDGSIVRGSSEVGGAVNLTPEQYRILFGESSPEVESRPVDTHVDAPVDTPVTNPEPSSTFDIPPQVRYAKTGEFDKETPPPRPPSTALVLVPPIEVLPERRQLRPAQVLIPLVVFAALIISPFLLDRFSDEPETEVLSEAVVVVEPSTAEPSTTAPSEENVGPASTATDLAAQRALDALRGATVVPLDQVTGGFDPDAYLADSWPDSDGDCQSDREEVLIDRSTDAVDLDVDGCRVVLGRWIDPFTGLTHTDPSGLRVIRTVPLEIAHQAGAVNWTRAQMRAFAVDAAFEPSLMVVAAATDDERAEQGPDQWRPEPPLQCAYAVDWVSVKTRWNLTYTAQEVDALQDMLTTCSS